MPLLEQIFCCCWSRRIVCKVLILGQFSNSWISAHTKMLNVLTIPLFPPLIYCVSRHRSYSRWELATPSGPFSSVTRPVALSVALPSLSQLAWPPRLVGTHYLANWGGILQTSTSSPASFSTCVCVCVHRLLRSSPASSSCSFSSLLHPTWNRCLG